MTVRNGARYLLVALAISLLCSTLAGVGTASNHVEWNTGTPNIDEADSWKRLDFEVKQNGDAEVSLSVDHLRRDDQGEPLNQSAYYYGDPNGDHATELEQHVVTTMEQFAAASSEQTGREMKVTLTRSAGTFDRETGMSYRFEFTWTNFAEIDDERAIVTEPFASHPQLFSRAAGAEVVVASPDGWAAYTSNVEPRNVNTFDSTTHQSFVYYLDSDLTGLELVFSPGDVEATATATQSATASSATTSQATPSGFPLDVIGVGVGSVLTLVLALMVWRRRDVE